MLEAEKAAEDSLHDLNFESNYLKECRVALGKKAAEKNKASENHEQEKETTEEDSQEPLDPVLAEIKKKASDAEYSVTPTYASDPVLKEAMEKEAFLGGFGSLMSMGGLLSSGPMHDMAKHHMGDAAEAAFKPSGLHSSAKPNMTMDNMERKLLLQELMLTDPILSKVNPAKVARAYEQLLRLSPEVSKEKEVVRAELRAMTASQALGRFEADTLTKLDLGMLKRRIATHEFNSGSMDHSRL
jgi:hypothetical protein